MMGCKNRAREDSVVCTDFLLWAKSNTLSRFWAAGGVVELVPVRLCLNSVKTAYFHLSIFIPALLFRFHFLLLQRPQSSTTNLRYYPLTYLRVFF